MLSWYPAGAFLPHRSALPQRLVGIVSLGDLWIGGAEEESNEALKETSE